MNIPIQCQCQCHTKSLIKFDSIVNDPVERKASHERNRSTIKSHGHTCHGHVCHVHNVGQDSNQIQPCEQIPDRVCHQPYPTRCGICKGLPPPTVILADQTKVAHDHTREDGADSDKDGDGQEVSHEVVILIHPDGAHEEVYLNDGTAEGQSSNDETREFGPKRRMLGGNHACNLIGPGGDADGVALESDETSHKDEGSSDAGPQGKGAKDGEECDGFGTSVNHEEDVQQHEDSNHETGEEECCGHGIQLPTLAAAEFEEPRGDISRNRSTEDIDHDDIRQGLSLHGRIDQTRLAQEKRDEDADCDLSSTADQHRQCHGRSGRGTEYIPVDHLPPTLILLVFRIDAQVVVERQILAQGLDEDDGNAGGEEGDHHDGIEDAHVVRGGIVPVGEEEDVPSVRPRLVGLDPLDLVGVGHGDVAAILLVGLEVEEGVFAVAHGLGPAGAVHVLGVVLDGDGLDDEADDADEAGLGVDLVVLDGEPHVVVQEVGGLVGGLVDELGAHGVAAEDGPAGLLDVRGEAVHAELHVVLPGHELLDPFDGLVVKDLGAERGAGLVLEDLDVVQRERLEGLAHEPLAEVLALAVLELDLGHVHGGAHGQLVVRERQLGLAGRDGVHGDGHLGARAEFLRRGAGEEDVGERGLLLLEDAPALALLEVVLVDLRLDVVEGGALGLGLLQALEGHAGGAGGADFVQDRLFDLGQLLLGRSALLGCLEFFFEVAPAGDAAGSGG